MAKAIYILFLLSLILPLTGLIAVILAYVYQGNGPVWLETHFRYQIRTFWIGLLYSVIGIVTAPVLVGYLILLFVLVWMIIRCAKGLQQLDNQAEVEKVSSWLF
jgi:uncharacterized membrane protein